MKLLVVIPRLGVGGAERLVIDDIHECMARGIDVELLTLQPEKEATLMGELRLAPEHRHMVPFKSFFNMSGWRALVAHIRVIAPDAVVSHLWFANAVVRLSRPWHNARVIAFEHNVVAVKTLKMRALDRLLQRACERIVAVSGAVRDSLVAHGVAPARIVVILNAVDVRRYRGATPTEQGITFLYIGRLIYQKGIDVLLDAFARTKTGVLAIAGEGVEKEALVAHAKRLGVEDRVRFLGVRHDVPGLLASAKCFVLPSRWEGLPMVLLEALAAHRAVVVSDFASAREVIVDGVSGRIVPREDSAALGVALEEVAGDPALRARLEAGTQGAIAPYTIEAHVDALVALLS